MAVHPSEDLGAETNGETQHHHAAETSHPEVPVFVDEHRGTEEEQDRNHHVGFVKQVSDHER